MQEKGQIRSAEKSFCDVGRQCMPPCPEFDLQLPKLPSFDSLPTTESFTDEGVTGSETSGSDKTITDAINDTIIQSATPGNETVKDPDCCDHTTIIALIVVLLIVFLIVVFLIFLRFRRKTSKLQDKYYPGNPEAANGGGKSQIPSEQVPLNSWVRTPTSGPEAQSAEPVDDIPSQVSRTVDSETSQVVNDDDLLGQPEVGETQSPSAGLTVYENSTVVDLQAKTQVPLNSLSHTSDLGPNAQRAEPVGENTSQADVSDVPKLVRVRGRTLPQISSVDPLVGRPEVPKIVHSETLPQISSDDPLGQPEVRETQTPSPELLVDEKSTVVDLQMKTSHLELVNS